MHQTAKYARSERSTIIELQEEYEQSERVRGWLRNNGGAIVGGVGVGLALIVGWQWWKNQEASRRADAASQHQAVVQAAEAGDVAKVTSVSKALQEKHAGTPYATLSALRVAESQLAAGDAKAALATLASARGTSSDAALDGLLVLRVARLQLAADDAKAALATLDRARDRGYLALVSELRGDAQLALRQRDAARKAYEQALTHLDSGAPNRRLLELKLIDIGGAPAVRANPGGTPAAQPGT